MYLLVKIFNYKYEREIYDNRWCQLSNCFLTQYNILDLSTGKILELKLFDEVDDIEVKLDKFRSKIDFHRFLVTPDWSTRSLLADSSIRVALFKKNYWGSYSSFYKLSNDGKFLLNLINSNNLIVIDYGSILFYSDWVKYIDGNVSSISVYNGLCLAEYDCAEDLYFQGLRYYSNNILISCRSGYIVLNPIQLKIRRLYWEEIEDCCCNTKITSRNKRFFYDYFDKHKEAGLTPDEQYFGYNWSSPKWASFVKL